MLSIHPLFLVFLLVAFFSGVGGIAVALLFGVIIHELSHAAVAWHFGIKTKRLKLLPFGAAIEIEAAFVPTKEKIIILLAGSFGNIVCALSMGLLLWIAPAWFSLWEILIIANAVPALLNLLPIYPFDGGKILAILGGLKFAKVIHIFSVIMFGAILVCSVFLWFNVALALLAGTMVIMLTTELKHTRFTTKFKSSKKHDKVVEVVVKSSIELFEMYKLVDAKYFTKFLVMDDENRAVYENEVEKLLLLCEANTSLGDALSYLSATTVPVEYAENSS